MVPEDFEGEVDPARLEHETEKRLAALVSTVSAQIDELIEQRRYGEALDSFAAMAPELETFFADVLVMVEDEGLRNNRWALLRQTGNVVARIAIVTRIVIDRKELAAS